jgi:hypothetical protein
MIIVLVALLVMAAVGAWLIIDPPQGGARDLAAAPVEYAALPSEQGTATEPDSDAPAANYEELIRAEAARVRAGRDSEELPDRPRAEPTPSEAPEGRPRRDLSPAQREEVLRKEQGRPALAQRMERLPASLHNANLARPTDQREWEKSWINEGINPPEMIQTPVQGKIMSEQAREGLASAVVHLMTFFPMDGVAGGPLLPVVTDIPTDKNGNFRGEVPASKVAPLDFAPAAIGVTWQSKRILAALPLERLKAGQQNALGIFWAPEFPCLVYCKAEQFAYALSVVATGQINPQRLHKTRQAEFVNTFTSARVTPGDSEPINGNPPGQAKLTSTWDWRVAPFVSLHGESGIIQTRVPARQTEVVAGAEPTEPDISPFHYVVFTNDAYAPISGVVVDSSGTAVSGAVVSAQGGDVVQSAITDLNGWFFIEKPHEKTYAVRVWHNDFVEMLASAKPGETDLRITLTKPRPRIRLHLTDKLTTAPITELSFKVIGIHPWGKQRGKPMPEAYTSLASTNGHYLLEWEYEVRSITLEKLGYFPRLIDQPLRVQDKSGGEIEVQLSPGRNLEVQPRNYSAVQQSDRWFPDAQGGPGITSYWSHHWIEYQIDFGEAPEQGEQGGFFDIVLGCTNQGIVDNQYQFNVDVFVDEVKRGTLAITADSITVREGRLRLGALSGQHQVRLMWTNDKWIPEQLDANIRYATLKFIEQPK